MLSWVHIGDLHASDEDGWESVDRLARIVDIINEQLADEIDFVFLPDDNANHGLPGQYERIAGQLARLDVPYRCIPGDHDFEPGSLHAYSALWNSSCPHVWMMNGRRCLFLDTVSAGTGGPDFALGPEQSRWLAAQLDDSRGDPLRPVVFMHAYPGDLGEEGRTLAHRFAGAGVAFVDTGHTHYNELLNDGHVVYGATRSTGQIEEDAGRPGFSLVQLDGNVLSWRFRRLDDPWPLLMITSPADFRLVTPRSEIPAQPWLPVRARVFGRLRGIDRMTVEWPGGRCAMRRSDRDTGVWETAIADLPRMGARLTVRARLEDGQVITDEIEPGNRSSDISAPLGSDAWAVAAWPEHGLLGTQLGPNKGGRKW